jgi:hypothetical protein
VLPPQRANDAKPAYDNQLVAHAQMPEGLQMSSALLLQSRRKRVGKRIKAILWRCGGEPLLHFLLVGALIFAAYQYLNPAAARTDSTNQIAITKDDLRQLAFVWIAQGRGVPSPGVMRTLVDQKVSEEILSREAAALGLDKNDEIIKRRLAQKMDFLAADVAALQDPGDAELRAWFGKNSARFQLPARASFRHLYFSLDRGPDARDAALAALTKVVGQPSDTNGLNGIADQFMFQDYYGDRTTEQVAKDFGPDFAKALFQTKPGAWQGPIQSGYGWHLVFVESIEPKRTPAFEEVEPDIKSAWLEDKQAEIRRTAFNTMRVHYKVTVAPIDAAELATLAVPPVAAAAASEVMPQ